MSTPDIASEFSLRYQVVLSGLDVRGLNTGWWKGDEVERGSEVKSDWDPRYGDVTIGGRKTGDDLKIERLWDKRVEPQLFRTLERIRGVATGFANLFQFDGYEQPASTTPITVMQVRLVAVMVPKASDSGDGATIKATLKVRA